MFLSLSFFFPHIISNASRLSNKALKYKISRKITVVPFTIVCLLIENQKQIVHITEIKGEVQHPKSLRNAMSYEANPSQISLFIWLNSTYTVIPLI